MTISPKVRFQQSKDAIATHNRVIEQDSFQAAVEASLLAYQGNLPIPVHDTMAAANYYRIEGARAFANTLLSLAEPTPTPKKQQTPTLNYGV